MIRRAAAIVAVAAALSGSCHPLWSAQRPPRSFDHAIVVLGCAAGDDGTPSPELARRLERALADAQADPAAVVVVTGGAVHSRFPEGRALREWLVAHGVAEGRIAEDDDARSTVENCENVAPMLRSMKVGHVTLVTEAYHLPRGTALLRVVLDHDGMSAVALDGDAAPDLLEGDAKAARARDEQAALDRDLATLRAGHSP